MATSTVTTVEMVRLDELLKATERGAVAGFLAGYTGNTLISYTTDLRLFVEWCITSDVRLFEVRLAHLEILGRTMEANGRMRSTVARRRSTLGSFYRYCHVEGILERHPAANVRRPKSRPSHAPSGWTATNSAGSSSKPDSAQPVITR